MQKYIKFKHFAFFCKSKECVTDNMDKHYHYLKHLKICFLNANSFSIEFFA